MASRAIKNTAVIAGDSGQPLVLDATVGLLSDAGQQVAFVLDPEVEFVNSVYATRFGYDPGEMRVGRGRTVVRTRQPTG